MIKNKNGQLTLQVLVFGSIAVVLIGGFIVWSNLVVRNAFRGEKENLAFSIAEAGVEYYRWHLAHAPTDYQDGTGAAGPYTHDYKDKDGNILGQFILDITPPAIGSTVVTITSTGVVTADRPYTKIIKVRLGQQSLAKYAFLTSAFNRFGAGTEVFGTIHSNDGIRFDGLAHNLVTSAVSEFDDPDHSGGKEYGAHTHVNIPPETGINNSFRPLEATPTPMMSRPDVFQAGRQIGVPRQDFTGLTQDLSAIRTDASSSGIYYPSSTAYGYHLVLGGNSFDLYRVTELTAQPYLCVAPSSQVGAQWGTWSVASQLKIATSTPYPVNGLMFFEDNLWVDGQINNARLTIASGRFPLGSATSSNITVNNDLLYTNYDGKDVISLIAQYNVNIGMVSANVIRVDGALVAQNGRVGRFFYSYRCAPYDDRQTITTYGMIASSLRYGFAYTDGSGYAIRNLNYDSNLLYGPPPSFPLTTDQYSLLSWDEIR